MRSSVQPIKRSMSLAAMGGPSKMMTSQGFHSNSSTKTGGFPVDPRISHGDFIFWRFPLSLIVPIAYPLFLVVILFQILVTARWCHPQL